MRLTVALVANKSRLVIRCLMKLPFVDVGAVQVVASQQRQQIAALAEFHGHVEAAVVGQAALAQQSDDVRVASDLLHQGALLTELLARNFITSTWVRNIKNLM